MVHSSASPGPAEALISPQAAQPTCWRSLEHGRERPKVSGRETMEGVKRKVEENPNIHFSDSCCTVTWQNNHVVLSDMQSIYSLYPGFLVLLPKKTCCSAVRGQRLKVESREMSSGVGRGARLCTLRAWTHVYFINMSTATRFCISIFAWLKGREATGVTG